MTGFESNPGKLAAKGELVLIWRVVRTVGRNGRLAGVMAASCAGIIAFAAISQPQSDVAPMHEVVRQNPLEDRVSSAPESLLKRFGNQLNSNISTHAVTAVERAILVNALAQLTPFQREVLWSHLRAIYLIDGLPNNALTFPDNGPTVAPMYSIAIRAGTLHETVSELVTRKERTLFDNSGFGCSVMVDA